MPPVDENEMTLAQFGEFIKKHADVFLKKKREEMIKHKDDWYEGVGPDDYKMELAGWWGCFDDSD